MAATSSCDNGSSQTLPSVRHKPSNAVIGRGARPPRTLRIRPPCPAAGRQETIQKKTLHHDSFPMNLLAPSDDLGLPVLLPRTTTTKQMIKVQKSVGPPTRKVRVLF